MSERSRVVAHYKSENATERGLVTTRIVRLRDDESFVDDRVLRIQTFKLGALASETENEPRHKLWVEVWGGAKHGWNTLIYEDDIAEEEVKAWIEADRVIPEVEDFISRFFEDL